LVPDFLVMASLGDDGSAPVWKAPLKAGTLGKLELFRSNEPRGESTLPAAIAVTPQGYVLTSQQDATDSQASRLKFVNPLDGKTALQLTVNLREITGLAYSPNRALLYAVGFESRERRRGGVYRIDAGEPGQPAAVVKVADVERPTAVAFGPDGALYVTSLGASDDSEPAAGGVLLKFSGEF
jgi:DNA-binding beta-propeller fold protein YncE